MSPFSVCRFGLFDEITQKVQASVKLSERIGDQPVEKRWHFGADPGTLV